MAKADFTKADSKVDSDVAPIQKIIGTFEEAREFANSFTRFAQKMTGNYAEPMKAVDERISGGIIADLVTESNEVYEDIAIARNYLRKLETAFETNKV